MPAKKPKKTVKPQQSRRGRAPGATQVVAVNLQERVAELWLSGKSPAEIATEIDRSERSVFAYLSAVRLQLIAQKKEHFDQRLALMLDDAMDGLASQSRLLADVDFLRTAEPERIDAIAKTFGIFTDKCFILLAAAGRGRAAAGEGQAGVKDVSGGA